MLAVYEYRRRLFPARAGLLEASLQLGVAGYFGVLKLASADP
ncbi:MAG: hypothetical protein WHX60_06395 [Armatimonadota bacterium]